MGKALTLLLTRPDRQSRQFLEECQTLAGRKLQAVISPVVEPVSRQQAVDLTGVQALIFTSANGVRAVQGLPGLTGLVAYCVGDRTASAANAMGCRPHSASGNVEDLIDLILAEKPAGKLMYLRGQKTRGDLAGRLSKAGFNVDEAIVYDMVEQDLMPEAKDLISSTEGFVAPVFSPESARMLAPHFRSGAATGHVVAISMETAEKLGDIPQAITVCSAPNSTELSRAVLGILL